MNTYTLPFPPSLNMMYPSSKTGRRFTSKRGKNFKEESRKLLQYAYKAKMVSGDLQIKIMLYRPKKQGDIDNYIKPVLDAMQGICFEDDKQVAKLSVQRFEDKDNPRVVVAVKEM